MKSTTSTPYKDKNSMEDTISIILTVHNQEAIINSVINNIADNLSEHAKEFLIIFDGCTDRSQEEAAKILGKIKIPIFAIATPDLNEVKANNVGLKKATGKYALLIQDDMIIKEKDFDKVLLLPFKEFDNVLAVSGRDAVDARLIDGKIDFYNVAGKDVGTPKGIFSVRDIVNRGPFLVDMNKMKELNYFDEEFAPITQDDTDLCFRAYKKGWIVGSFVIDYDSDISWSWNRRNPESARIREAAEQRNFQKLIDRHLDMITGEKHSITYKIEGI